MKARTSQFVICVKNTRYTASLNLRKIYQALPDPVAAKHGHMRIVDESGDDYLYPADYFVKIQLPQTVERAVRMAS